MSGHFLTAMANASRERARQAKSRLSESALAAKAVSSPPPLPLKRGGDFDIIAEFKLRSPATGALRSSDEDVAARVTAYAEAGAAAVSVLTEPSRFDGTLAHLQSASGALAPRRVPAMRKDFLVEPYQVLETRLAGGSGVLVILRMLPRAGIEALADCALDLGMFVLLETFDERDIETAQRISAARARHAGKLLIGVNSRDLETLRVMPGRLEQLAGLLPRNVARVAESGVASAADARRLAQAGYDLALVGSALMTDHDPAGLLRAMLAAGRAAREELPACG